MKSQLDQLEDEKETLQIKVSEQELHIMEQHDIIQDQVSEIEELNMHSEMQTTKIVELEKDIKRMLENKEFFEKAKKDLDESIKNPKRYMSPQSSCCGDVTQRSSMQYLEDDFSYLDKEFKALGINSAQKRKESDIDPSPNNSNDSGGSKASHLTNRNQYCIKNKEEGEVVLSDEILNSPAIT